MRWSFSFPGSNTEDFSAANRLRRGRRRRRAWWASFSLVALLASALTVRATSVTPPTFPELVSEAQTIARATVTSIASRWVDGARGRVIKTFVTFSVEKRIKGDSPDTVTLEFLGGSVGGDTLKVSGMPEFKVGDTEIVFVQGNGVQFCPLVRFGHGRYHVRSDAATLRRFITRNDDTPLASTSEVQLPAESHGPKVARSIGAGMTPEEFENEITQEVSRAATR